MRHAKLLAASAAALALAGCATSPSPVAIAPVTVKIIAFNDFHGNIEPPRQAINTAPRDADPALVPAGGVAYLASAIERLRAENPNHVVVSAGDMVGASPLSSALFLDEPTIAAMNLIGVDMNAVGNHEFDRGRAELLRMQQGGCGKNTRLEPCQVDPQFPGARFSFLAANTLTESGAPLFAPYKIRSFGEGGRKIDVAFIGLTLKETPTIVSPAGVAGLSFADEAATINALVPRLRAEGAEAIVVVIHQGAGTDTRYNEQSCAGLTGPIVPILQQLDPAVDLVVSGHTHRAYICDYGTVDPSRPFLLTSAGQYGTLLSDITLTIDPAAGRVTGKQAQNVIIASTGYDGSRGRVDPIAGHPPLAPHAGVAALVATYVEAARPLASRVVGRLAGPATREFTPAREHAAGDLIADAQLTAMRGEGAQIAFMNPGGVRAELNPGEGGAVTYGQIFAVQPFGNWLVMRSFTGRQIKAMLEQRLVSSAGDQPLLLMPSQGFSYAYDLSRPEGQRIVEALLDGQPLADDRLYRVVASNFLAGGGDGFTLLREGTDERAGPSDIDALEAYLSGAEGLQPPVPNRIRNLTPAPPAGS